MNGIAQSAVAREIAPGVHCLEPKGRTQTNVYFVRSGSAWALVDAGWASDAPSIKQAAEAVFGPDARPAAILLTHFHPDHAGSALGLARTWDCPVYLHPDELSLADGDFGTMTKYAGPLDRWVVLPLMRAIGQRRREAVLARSSLRGVALPFEEGARIPDLPGWEVIHTPGHTPGHVSFFRASDRVLITGDAVVTLKLNALADLVRQRQGLSGPPRYTSWNWPAARDSVATLARLEPRVLAGGHGTPMTDPGTAGALRAFADQFSAGHRKERPISSPRESMTAVLRVRVSAFGGPEVLTLESATLGKLRDGHVRVRVTHASVGATDALARRGGYLLQPRPGFVPGYDLVGIVEASATRLATAFPPGMRVAAVLPRMAAYATRIDIPGRLLVPVPEALPSDFATTLPLDAVTAALALDLAACPTGGTLFIQGVSGSVGSLLAQLAQQRGFRVVGSASAANQSAAEALGIEVVDYRDPGWIGRNLGRFDAAVDYTGSSALRAAMKRDGVLVHTAFAGRPGRERRDTFTGSISALARSFAHPRERVCSVPLLVATRTAAYRRTLSSILDRASTGALRLPAADCFPIANVREAHRRVESGTGQAKVVLLMPGEGD